MLDFLTTPGVNPFGAAWEVIKAGGWIPMTLFLLWVGVKAWVYARQNWWAGKQKFILLAIDVPEEHAQSPMAAEHIFSTIWGTYASINKLDNYWRGKFQLATSFEIVSIEGYVQFLIHTPAHFRDTVEAALYAQYPNCEIVEVEDYAQYGPKSFPSETHKMWGTEMMESKSHFYPIRTYKYFEDSLATDQKITDPVASLLEVLAKIGPGEQIWIQWVLTPVIDSWQSGAKKVVDKLAGKKVAREISPVEKIFAPIGALFSGLGNLLAAGFDRDGTFGTSTAAESSSDEAPSLMLHLSPGERATLEAIENKASKAGFATKMRFIYLAENDRYSVPRGVPGVMGAFKQYSDLNLNSVRPLSKTMTSTDYLFAELRLNWIRDRLIRAYRGRSQSRGGGPGFILNTEELASFWHFPADYVRTPQLKRSSVRSVEPPPGLPTERRVQQIAAQPHVTLDEPVAGQPLSPMSASATPTSGSRPQVVLEGDDEAPAPVPEKAAPTPPPSIQQRAQAPSKPTPQASGGPPDNLPVG